MSYPRNIDTEIALIDTLINSAIYNFHLKDDIVPKWAIGNFHLAGNPSWPDYLGITGTRRSIKRTLSRSKNQLTIWGSYLFASGQIEAHGDFFHSKEEVDNKEFTGCGCYKEIRKQLGMNGNNFDKVVYVNETFGTKKTFRAKVYRLVEQLGSMGQEQESIDHYKVGSTITNSSLGSLL